MFQSEVQKKKFRKSNEILKALHTLVLMEPSYSYPEDKLLRRMLGDVVSYQDKVQGRAEAYLEEERKEHA